MNKFKKYILSKIHRGNNIIQYKRSYKHPLLNKKCFNDTFGFFTITKIWNIKRITDRIWQNYEANHSIKWNWKVEIINDSGKYILPLSTLYNLGLYDDKGKIMPYVEAFIFYK